MPQSRGLPFGRPPTQPPQSQFLDERRRSVPSADGWLLSGASQTRTLSISNSLTADTLYLNEIEPLARDYLLHEARINVNSGVAASRVKAGIYILQEDGLGFRLISGTDVDFDTSTTATNPYTLQFNRPVSLYSGNRYFIGGLTTGGASRPVVTCLQSPSRVWAALSKAGTTIPETINMASLSDAFVLNMATVVYVSQSGARVL